MTAGYVVLTAAGLWHGLVGGMKVVGWGKRLFAKSKVHAKVEEVIDAGNAAIGERTGHEAARPKKSKRRVFSFRGIVMSLVGIVCVGLIRLGREAQGASLVSKGRYTAVFDAAPWARIGLR